MNQRGKSCSELRSRHCTPAWVTETLSQKKREREKEREKRKKGREGRKKQGREGGREGEVGGGSAGSRTRWPEFDFEMWTNHLFSLCFSFFIH